MVTIRWDGRRDRVAGPHERGERPTWDLLALKLFAFVALVCIGAAVVDGVTEGLTRAAHAVVSMTAGG